MIMTSIRRALGRGRAAGRHRSGVRDLERSTEPAATAILDSLAGWESLGADEAAAIKRIEVKRAELESSEERLVTPAVTWSDDKGDERVVDESVGEVCRTSSKPPRWALALFRLLRAFEPEVAIELGTCLGVSAAYQAAALALNGRGRLHTFEASPARLAVAGRFLADLHLDQVTLHQGRFDETLTAWIETLRDPIDYGFIDGHHDEVATLRYFNQILAHARPGALLAFDDIYWSAGMTRAWRQIAGDARIGLSVDLREIGLCVVGGTSLPAPIRARLP